MVQADKDVLPGPKSPVWGCSCGEAHNWASRLKCRGCSKAAPAAVRARAQAAAKDVEGKGSAAGSAGQASRLAKLEAELKGLKAENKALRSATGSAEASGGAEADAAEGGKAEIDRLSAALEAVKLLGDEAMAQSLQARLDAARQKAVDAKPLSAILGLQRKLERRRKASTALDAKVAALQADLASANAEATEAKAEVAQMELELKRLHERAIANRGDVNSRAASLYEQARAILPPGAAEHPDGQQYLASLQDIMQKFAHAANVAAAGAAPISSAENAAAPVLGTAGLPAVELPAAPAGAGGAGNGTAAVVVQDDDEDMFGSEDAELVGILDGLAAADGGSAEDAERASKRKHAIGEISRLVKLRIDKKGKKQG